MSTSDSKVFVRIEAATPLTEISISNSRFEKVRLEHNSGPLELRLPAGVYEITFRDGTFMQQQLAILSESQQQPVTVRQEASQMPPDEPVEASEPTGRARIEVVIRRKSTDDEIPYVENSLSGLSICDVNGIPIPSPAELPGATPSTLLFDTSPGFYRLRLNTGLEGQILETPVILPPNWIVALSCPLRRYRKDDYRADLVRAEVRMHPADSLHTRGREERSLERKALALLAGRRTLSGKAFNELVDGLLAQKYINPMFGFYAAHLLRIEDGSSDVDILAKLVDHLGELIDPNRVFLHPDLEALRLRLQLLRMQKPEHQPFTFPPMLTAGWRTILKVAVSRSDLVPRGSLCDLISPCLVASDAHLVWALPEEPVAPMQSVSVPRVAMARERAVNADLGVPEAGGVVADADATADGIHVINVALQSIEIRDWFRQEARLTSTSDNQRETAFRIGEVEKAVALAIRPIAPNEKSQPIFERLQASERTSSVSTANELAVRLHLPIATVERAIRDVSQKLTEQTVHIGITVREKSAMARPELIIPYDPNFLGDGFSVPMPVLSDALHASAFAGGAVLDYTHYSLVMHAARRVAIFTAHNVDASRSVRVKGGLTWKMDERAGENQLGPETYDGNQLDKGHLVRREDVLWGPVPEAKLANKATYFYTNAAPQHKNFNQDEWVTLEDWILDKATDFSYRLCVFTGPVLRSNDPVLNDLPTNLRTMFRAHGPAQIPAAFWKVVVLRDATAGGEDLSVVCFAMRQSEMWNDREGRRLLSLKVHQVTLKAIQDWTGLDFGGLNDLDELAWSEERTRAAPTAAAEAEWPTIRSADDIVFSGPTRRLRGLRAGRGAEAPRSARAADAPQTGASCADCGGAQSFDAREAVAALSREVARLTEVVAGLGPSEGVPPGGVRVVAAGVQEVAGTPEDDERVERMVAAAPDHMKDQVREFAREVVTQHDVARGVIPVPAPTELERIVGGNRVQAGAIPSCVCIGSATQWFCTGVVVAPRVVLTASHCGANITRILIGDQSTPTLQGRVVAVRQVIIHPNYRQHPFNENDISILILDTSAAIPPARLATTEELKQASQVHLVGFGYNDPQQPKGFGIKREVRAPMGPIRRSDADNLTQFEQLTGFHSAYEFVAGRKGLGRDTCNGDSGGPAYIDTNQGSAVAGLTSRATRDANVPCGAGGIYVRTDSFRTYINGMITSLGLSPLA